MPWHNLLYRHVNFSPPQILQSSRGGSYSPFRRGKTSPGLPLPQSTLKKAIPVYIMLLRVHLFRLNSHTSAKETAEARQAINGIFTAVGRPFSPMKFIKS